MPEPPWVIVESLFLSSSCECGLINTYGLLNVSDQWLSDLVKGQDMEKSWFSLCNSVKRKIALCKVVPTQMAGHSTAGHKGNLTFVDFFLGARCLAGYFTYLN